MPLLPTLADIGTPIIKIILDIGYIFVEIHFFIKCSISFFFNGTHSIILGIDGMASLGEVEHQGGG